MVQFAGDDQDEADDRAAAAAGRRLGSATAPRRRASSTTPDGGAALGRCARPGWGPRAHPPGSPTPGLAGRTPPSRRTGSATTCATSRDLLDASSATSETALYGHFGQGCVHTRIPFDLRTADGVAAFRAFVERAADLVVSYGGSLSGEHGDGQARGELLARMFGDELVAAFGGSRPCSTRTTG